jgi:tetratricopeptide (TPR) repeat protein
LSSLSCADLLYTSGELAGWLASSKQLQRGQKHAEALLNGSIALFEQLGFTKRAAEGRIELALCYYRQGLFDIGRSTLIQVINNLTDDDFELCSLALIRLASLERHAGRLKDALTRLLEARPFVEVSGPWATGRCHLELASTYKDLASAENISAYFDYARFFYIKALREFEAVGHHRYVAVVENNVGFLLLNLTSYEESEKHLRRARKLFDSLSDLVREAQVNETLARLYTQTKEYDLAHQVIERAVKTLAQTDGEALLSEALRTQGVLASRLGNHGNAKRCFQAAYQVAERCGDREGAGRALLLMIEEIGSHLEQTEKLEMAEVLQELFLTTQPMSVRARIKTCLTEVSKPVDS